MLSNEQITDQTELIQALMPEVRAYIGRHFPRDWPALRDLAGPLIDQPLKPPAMLPLASCAAAGGEPREAIPAAAAWQVLLFASGLLDDAQDQDRPDGLWAQLGPARAFNFSAALYTAAYELLACAPWSAERYRIISRRFARGALQLAAGQDRDLRGATRSYQEYWQTIDGKNGAAFALACAIGALCGTTTEPWVVACEQYGRHLGLALQLFDDFEGLWSEQGPCDLAAEHITLPIIYGLHARHPGRSELQAIVERQALGANIVRVRQLLDDMGARDFMLWVALQERSRAINALAVCPGTAGVATLTTYIDTIFIRIDELRSGSC